VVCPAEWAAWAAWAAGCTKPALSFHEENSKAGGINSFRLFFVLNSERSFTYNGDMEIVDKGLMPKNSDIAIPEVHDQ